MPTIHLIAPFHTVSNVASSHCAFTQKSVRFSLMMKPYGYKVIEYSNEGSESVADEHEVMLSAAEFKAHYKPEVNSPGAQASTTIEISPGKHVVSPGFALFRTRLLQSLTQRAQMGDIVAHPFGPNLYPDVVHRLPGCVHVETGIGYPWSPMGAYPIFESEAWRHYQWGRWGNPGGVLPNGNVALTPARTWVIPNYFNVEEWPVSLTPENAVVFMSRFVIDKGIEMLAQVIKAWDRKHPNDGLKFVMAGMGDFEGWKASAGFSPSELARIEHRGIVIGRDRATLLGRGKAFILPTIFVEPFGGAAVEAMLCGTPALVPTFGAFTETVEPGMGFHCRTVDDYVRGIENAPTSDREFVAQRARERYSLEACGKLYDAVFKELTARPSIE